MRNARISFILWLLFPLLAAAQLPPLTRSVLTTNIPAFGSAGQALFRISVPPYLNWSNVVASGGLSISDSNNIINLASNYTYAVSNYAYTASNALSGQIVTASNAVLNASSNYTFAVSNLVVASTNGQFIEKTGGVGTNTTIRQANQTGPALTIGTNAGAVFSIMGVTNGPGWAPLVQIGSPMLAANSGGTNAFLLKTNAEADFFGNVNIGVSGKANQLTVSASGAGNQITIENANDTPGTRGGITIDRYRGTIASPSAVSSTNVGDSIGFFGFRPYDGSGLVLSSLVESFVDGSVSVGSVPARLSFVTGANLATRQERFTIKNNGLIGVDTNNPFALFHVYMPLGITNQYVRISGTTNNPTLETLDTNGVLTVKSNVVAQGGLISTNDFVYQRDQTGSALTIGTNAGAVFSIMGVTNGPSPYTIQVGNATTGTTNDFLLGTNRNAYFGGKIGIGVASPTGVANSIDVLGDGIIAGTIYAGGNGGNNYPVKFWNSSSANGPQLRHQGTFPFSVLELMSAAGTYTPSNGLQVCGHIIASNGIIAKVHSSYATNIVPLTVIPHIGTTTNVIEAQGSNGVPILTLSEPGVLTVKSNVFIGTQMLAAQPIGLYGSMMMNATNMNAYGAAYTNVSGYNVAITNGFFANLTTGDITNTVAGYYRCTISISFAGQNAHLYEGCLLTNGVDPETIAWRGQFDTPARMRSQTGTGIIYLPAGTRCHFAIKDETGAGDVAINRASIVLGTP